MTEDMAKAPRAAPAPKMSVLDRQIADAKHRLTFALTDDLKRYYADKVIGLRFDRGDFPMIQGLDTVTRRALVIAMLREKPNGQ